MKKTGLALCFLAVLILTLYTIFFPYAFAVTETEARLAIESAQGKIVECYNAVVDVEKAGGNITDLLSRLDDAGGLLSKATLAYSYGEFDEAHDFAVQSEEGLEGFVDEANALKETAKQEKYWDFVITVIAPIVGAELVVCGSFAVWFLLKRKYAEVGSEVE